MNRFDTLFKKSFRVVLIGAAIALAGCESKSEKAGNVETAASKHAGDDHAEHAHDEADHGDAGHDESAHAGHTHREAEAEKVVLTAQQIENVGLQFATVGPVDIAEALPLYGAIVPNAERVRDVGARYAGTIRRVDRKIGDTVRQGDTLATVESNESLQTYSITAPLAGVVTVRNANPGEQTTDKPLFTIADFSSVWVELSLFPRDAAKVRVGQPVRVRSVDAGLAAEATVAYVAPFGSSTNQTLTARVVLNNPEQRWAPGLYVSADVVLSRQKVALAVRNTALQTVEGRTVVFVEHLGDYEPHPVRLGRSDGEYTEILEGMDAGEVYATTNSFVLKAEMAKGEASHDH